MNPVNEPKLWDYLPLGQAANLLGVAPSTLRNWSNAGKIASFRHPVNGYRLFKREDVLQVRQQLAEVSE
jgi:MerR family transcriptional regulator, copper efflux regulator